MLCCDCKYLKLGQIASTRIMLIVMGYCFCIAHWIVPYGAREYSLSRHGQCATAFRPGMDSDYREYSGYAQRDKGGLGSGDCQLCEAQRQVGEGIPEKGTPSDVPLIGVRLEAGRSFVNNRGRHK